MTTQTPTESIKKDVLNIMNKRIYLIRKEIISISQCKLKTLYSKEDKTQDLLIMKNRIIGIQDLKIELNKLWKLK